MASGLRYSHILIFLVWLQVDNIIKITTWLYFSPEATNPKNKHTFFSSTFKLEGKKVPLIFGFGACWLRYSHVVILIIVSTWSQTKTMKNGYISAQRPQFQKIKVLSFLQVLKLKERKCIYFLDLWPLGWDIAMLSF